MFGMMQDHPLLISSLLQHAATNHAHNGIVSLNRDASGETLDRVTKTGYADLAKRSAQLAHALVKLGVRHGDRIATMAWNDQRHFELYYAISGIGAICHTVNPRLFPEQITYIIRHAEDRWIFIDPTILPVFESIFEDVKDIPAGIVVMSDTVPETTLAGRIQVLAYEDIVNGQSTEYDWPQFDEKTASSLCYTSGTTGNSKGVLYSHRSTLLHTWAIALPQAIAMHAGTTILPVVPMFHANAWGTIYAATMTGANLAMPGPKLDGQSLYELIIAAEATYIGGVPTVWMGLLEYLRKSGSKLPDRLRGIAGGSALPPALSEAYWKEHGVRIDHGWGMTEMSPVGAYNMPAKPVDTMSDPEVLQDAVKQGTPPFGVALEIIDDDGNELARDGQAIGELVARGHWVTSGYYNDEQANKLAFTEDGWFRTGDVATIDEHGAIELVDRVKDLIKSGGEWISSIELENLVLTMPGIREAAAVPARHKKWDERPLVIVVPEPNTTADEDSVRQHLAQTLPKWMLPDAVIFVDELPHTATGKIMKRTLRDQYASYLEEHGLDQA
jgi:acyl-CoA synthetase (AMP-forming)/AMP-acid ligase II